MKSKIFTKIIASAMSVMMIFSMSGVSVKAAQLQENNELKTVMVDMKDVATGDAIVYASTSTSTKTLSKDYATSTGQTGAITSIGQNVDFSSIIPQGSVIESITIYCPTGTRVTQSKYTTINNYLISSYETGTTATVSFKQTNSPSSTSRMTLTATEPMYLDSDNIVDGYYCLWTYEGSEYEAGTFTANSTSANSPWNTMSLRFNVY